MDEARLCHLKHKGDFYSARKEKGESVETFEIILLLLSGTLDAFVGSGKITEYFPSLLSTVALAARFSQCVIIAWVMPHMGEFCVLTKLCTSFPPGYGKHHTEAAMVYTKCTMSRNRKNSGEGATKSRCLLDKSLKFPEPQLPHPLMGDEGSLLLPFARSSCAQMGKNVYGRALQTIKVLHSYKMVLFVHR